MSLPIVSTILDPTYHSNSRTEFKIFGRNRLLSSKMRVSSFGVSGVTIPIPAPQASLNYEGGIKSLIKQASLYVNDILVDQVKDASKVLSIEQNVMSSYDANNIASKTACTSINPAWNAFQYAELRNTPLSHKLLGHLSLESVFPLLKSLMFLPDCYEIRIVFEYETALNVVFAAPRPTAFTVSEPKLIYDEIMEMEKMAEALRAPVSIQFPCTLTERLIASNSVGHQSIRLRAFDNMSLGRLVMNAVIGNASDDELCFSKSDVVAGEVINFRVNGATLIPFKGIDHPAKKLHIAASSMGDHLSPLGGADGNFVADAFDEVYVGGLDGAVLEKLAYTAVDVNTRVNRLDFELDKTLAQAVYYYIYGKVMKYFIKKGDMVETGYL
jgi:hypothetical protein